MNPFANRMAGSQWVVPVSVLAAVLGFMLTMAWITFDTRQQRIRMLPPDQQSRINTPTLNVLDEYQKLASEVAKLREEKTKLENAMASQTNQAKLLNESLQEVKLWAGLTEVEGPGIAVTLRDSSSPSSAGIAGGDLIIHDWDVLRVVNELWNAGAEAIAVNNHRVVAGTSFRCVGTVIMVDNIEVSSPVVIRAIGDPDTLFGGVNIRNGVLAEIRSSDPNMVTVTKFERARLPAYTGSTTFRYLKIPESKP